jgi:energy-coupling factor transporter ATP-binding protein EcfA2
MKPELFSNISIKQIGDRYIGFTPASIALPAMIKELINDKSKTKCLRELSMYLPVSKPGSFYLDEFKNLGGRVIGAYRDKGSYAYTLSWDIDMLQLRWYEKTNNIDVHGFFFNETLAEQIDGLLRKHEKPAEKKGYVFAIVRAGQNLKLHQIGFAGVPLERSNYSEQVATDYDYIVKDLRSATPSGRIVILDGPPGSGKTYLTRSLLLDVPNASFVLVPPAMVNSLGGPELLPLLVRNKADMATDGPIILVLEDADSCLAPRAADNMSYISALLNLGDGIFGSVCDIRIIATTNVKRTEMDEAILRPGRLSRRINVEELDYERANQIHQRLISLPLEQPKKEEDRFSIKPLKNKTSWTLAEVYASARTKGWEPSVATLTSISAIDDVSEPSSYDDD